MGRQSSKHARHCHESVVHAKFAGHAICLPKHCASQQVHCSIMHYTIVSALYCFIFVEPYNVFAADFGISQGSMCQNKIMSRALQRNAMPSTCGDAAQIKDKDERKHEAT